VLLVTVRRLHLDVGIPARRDREEHRDRRDHDEQAGEEQPLGPVRLAGGLCLPALEAFELGLQGGELIGVGHGGDRATTSTPSRPSCYTRCQVRTIS
jgi:hypothetical protein